MLGLRFGDGASPLSTLSPAELPALPAALWGQDLLFVGTFMAGEWLTRKLWPRGRLFSLLYALLAIHSASNVPVMRMFGTPLSWAILRAAGPTLLDSLRQSLTSGSVLGFFWRAHRGALLPTLLRRLIFRVARAWPAVATAAPMDPGALIVACGLSALTAPGRPSALAGLGRNAVLSLFRSLLPQSEHAVSPRRPHRRRSLTACDPAAASQRLADPRFVAHGKRGSAESLQRLGSADHSLQLVESCARMPASC